MGSSQTQLDKIKLMLVDDHHMLRHGLRMLIEDQTDMEIVSEAADGKSALNILQSDPRVDIILADLNMPVMDGFTLLEQIQ